jgi:methylisocitrate lyase
MSAGSSPSGQAVSAGARLRAALQAERPLQVVGTINAYAALLAQRAGFRALYLSGAGVANASYGLPDLGITSLDDVCEDVRRISGACELPLLVDADTGWGGAFNIARAVKDLARSGAAGLHLEDQVAAKRCGHRPGKALVPAAEMVDRLAHAVEGQAAALERAAAYVEAGADMIFAEALRTLEEFKEFTARVRVPVLANITEFGQTPLFTIAQLAGAGVRLVLYPLSAFRAAARAQTEVYGAIRAHGTQQGVLALMQTRAELYEVLGYHEYERKLDELFGKEPS